VYYRGSHLLALFVLLRLKEVTYVYSTYCHELLRLALAWHLGTV